MDKYEILYLFIKLYIYPICNENSMLLKIIKEDDYWLEYPVNHDLVQVQKCCTILAQQILMNKNSRERLVIYVRGSSGVILGTMLTQLLKDDYTKIILSIVRKPNESPHGDSFIYRNQDFFQKIIVDDTMESGETVNSI